ncbi:carboxylesterase/lipase family protein [Micromonospora endolithica]|uniref:Carboxylic ester hydrolase n=1 Tax=Micromonospora endolithica TaxID=230091 RepID=A0A3A9ZJP1_9ACTN|nr:carboxylesterase family protein [Micromonospora endolithica]RKN48518.1 carboxylesterase family protein [Micromonospora endolithica]TWJ24397.1 para-nitrobenzyl esterase [Micromonospora endolithica]
MSDNQDSRPDRWSRLLRAVIAVAGLLVPAAASVPPANADARPDPAVVRTTAGQVRGVLDAEVRSFQGIPYAAPPIDDLRWASPQPVRSWKDVRDATAPGAACPQAESGYPIGVPSTVEDCLYLNVTAPRRPARDLPVIVWIHGGSMMVGSGDSYRPNPLVAAGAVVVSLNYRLGVMAFLTDAALDGPAARHGSGSLALEDQQAALRWVRTNIGGFGGDPDNVTVMGQSGGGYAVCDHLASPVSAGLFDRAVVQSAPCATGGSRTRAAAETESAGVIAAVGCATAADVATCLRATEVTTLLDAYEATAGEPRPVSGTALLPLPPGEALRTGRFNRVPVLLGVNHDEENGRIGGAELAPGGAPMRDEAYAPAIRAEFGADAPAVLRRYPLAGDVSAGEAFATVLTDALWSVPTLDTARMLSRWTPTHLYEFTAEDTPWYVGYPRPSFPMRANHMSELAYLFDMAIFEELTPAQLDLRLRLASTWVRFARTAEPARPDAWPAFRDDLRHGRYVRSLTPGRWCRADFTDDHHYSFWKRLDRS